MRKPYVIVIAIFVSLVLAGGIYFYLARKPKKSIDQNNPKENWVLTIPDKEICKYGKEHHLLLAIIDKGMTIVFDKNIRNGREKTEFEFLPQYPDRNHSLQKYPFVIQEISVLLFSSCFLE